MLTGFVKYIFNFPLWTFDKAVTRPLLKSFPPHAVHKQSPYRIGQVLVAHVKLTTRSSGRPMYCRILILLT